VRSRPALELVIQRASRAAHIPADARLRAWARVALTRRAIVALRYVAVAEGRKLNREFRGKEGATNVLTFIYDDAPRGTIAGDVVICAPVVAREARAQGKAVAAHHAHLLVHGLLHLQGYDHEGDDDAARMERRERAVLRRLGFPDPYA
jgi:probable rRNA maturation factor